MASLCCDALGCPCPNVKHGSPHHCRVKLIHLPSDVSLQLVEGGRARAVHLGLAPEAEVEGGEVGGARRPLSAPQAPPADDSVPKLVVKIPHVGIGAMD